MNAPVTTIRYARRQLPPGTQVKGAVTGCWYVVVRSCNLDHAEDYYENMASVRGKFVLSSGWVDEMSGGHARVQCRLAPLIVSEIRGAL